MTPTSTASGHQMPTLGDYPLRIADTEDRFHGNRLVYLSWENHLMYAAPLCLPLPPSLPFGALVRDVLPEVYGEHPEFEQIDWQRTLWFDSGRRFRPDFGKSLDAHGLGHKSLIRFVTPALTGIRRQLAPGRLAF